MVIVVVDWTSKTTTTKMMGMGMCDSMPRHACRTGFRSFSMNQAWKKQRILSSMLLNQFSKNSNKESFQLQGCRFYHSSHSRKSLYDSHLFHYENLSHNSVDIQVRDVKADKLMEFDRKLKDTLDHIMANKKDCAYISVPIDQSFIIPVAG